MKPIPYNTVKLSNENQQFQGYPVNYNNDYNYQVPMGQPMRNPQQYPYADHEMINPQMQNPQQYPYLDHNMINPEINNQPQIIVIETTGILNSIPTQRRPQMLFCRNCQKNSVSRVSYQAGSGAWLIGMVLFCFGCYICCFIPCCLQECLDCVHDCSNCGRSLGRVNFMD